MFRVAVDLVPPWLALLVAGAAALFLWIAIRNRFHVSSGQSSPASGQQRVQNRARPSLEILYPGATDDDAAEVDIIAVHGLGSNVDWSWTWHGDGRSVHWLRDLDMLPAKVPKARIVAYNYDSTWHSNAPKTRLQLCGEELAHSLQLLRKSAPGRPLILLGHSLGGLVILHALLYAESQDASRDLVRNTVGFISLGSPFRGTKMQGIADFAARFMAPAGSHRGIIRDLAFDNETLRDKLQEFCQLCKRLSMPTCCFFEEYMTDYGKRYWMPGICRGVVVGEESSCVPGWKRYSLQTDHFKMNKFSGPRDRSFISVSERVREMCDGWKEVMDGRRNVMQGHWTVPFGQNQHFVGRTAILDQLVNDIAPSASETNCQWTVIEGLGGVGKTQIAVEAAFRVRTAHPNCSVFWISAIDAATFANGYREIGEKLKVAGIDEDNADVLSFVKAALSRYSQEWLLIIDNVDDVDRLAGNNGSTSFYDCLPCNAYKGSILFTTRNHEVTSELDISPRCVIRVPEMSMAEATDLLRQNLSTHQTSDAESIEELLGFLTNLPLAIRQASAYMAKTDMTVAKYLSHCRSSDANLIELLSKDFSDRTRDEQSHNAIVSTWLISFHYVARHNPLAIQYLSFMSFLVARDIPRSILPQNSHELSAHEAIGMLKAFAFISERTENETFDMHRLVQLAMRNWLAAQGEAQRVVTDLVKQLDDIFPYPEHENKSTWVPYLPHVIAVLEFETDLGDEGAVRLLLVKTSRCYYILGNFTNTLALQRRLLPQMIRLFGPEHYSTLYLMNDMASTLIDLGEHSKAEAMHRQTLEIQMKVLGPEHPLTLQSKAILADVLGRQGNLVEAESLLRQTLELQRKILGEKHAYTAASICSLGGVLAKLGKFQEAESLFREKIQLQTERPGINQTRTPEDENNLATLLAQRGMHEQAEATHRKMLLKLTEDLGPEHPGTLEAMANLGGTLLLQNKYEEAESIFRHVTQMQGKAFGPENYMTLGNSTNMALALYGLGRCHEAELLCRRTLEKQVKVLGSAHPQTVVSMDILAYMTEESRRNRIPIQTNNGAPDQNTRSR